MAKDNRGFTFLELIVVITIMAIFLGFIAVSVYPSYSAKARRCATQTDVLISKCRVGALSRKGDVYLTLRTDSKGRIVGDYYEDSALSSSDILSDGKTLMTYVIRDSAGTENTVNLSAAPLTLSFSRSTGAFKAQSDGTYCTSINVVCGERTFAIALTPSTGAHELSQEAVYEKLLQSG